MKATKTESFDWVRLKLADGDIKANLTWSRNRDTISGNILDNREFAQSLVNAWTRYRDSKIVEGSLGARIDVALKAATASETMADFLAWLEEND